MHGLSTIKKLNKGQKRTSKPSPVDLLNEILDEVEKEIQKLAQKKKGASKVKRKSDAKPRK